MSLHFRFGRRSHHAEDEDSGETYLERLAVWQLEHRVDRHDMTEAQEKRYRLCNRIIDAGLDPKRIAYSHLRYRSGALHDNTR